MCVCARQEVQASKGAKRGGGHIRWGIWGCWVRRTWEGWTCVTAGASDSAFGHDVTRCILRAGGIPAGKKRGKKIELKFMCEILCTPTWHMQLLLTNKQARGNTGNRQTWEMKITMSATGYYH